MKTFWNKLMERVARGGNAAATLPARPAMEADRNDKVLVDVNEEQPVFRAVMDHAYAHVENNLAVAFDASKSVEERRDFSNRAAGVTAFIADVENTRARLKAERAEQQKLAAARPAAK
jgi:hypothetical protein